MVVSPLAVVMSQHLHDYLFCAILPTMPCVMYIGGLWKALEWLVLGVQYMLTCMKIELCCGWLQFNNGRHGRYMQKAGE